MDYLVEDQNTEKVNQKIDDIPGDKSISHRAAMCGALAYGTSQFKNVLFSEDCLNTIQIFRQMGVTIETKIASNGNIGENELRVNGVGLNGLKPPSEPFDVGNSGTSIRLLTGILAGQSFSSELIGDASIMKRPMKRVIDPLQAMGAQITGAYRQEDIYPPLKIQGNRPLRGTHITVPVASAQIKSAILFASLYAQGEAQIRMPQQCRDHSERMLRLYGAEIKEKDHTLTLTKTELQAPKGVIQIPSDISSAAFFMVLGCIRPKTRLCLTKVGLNKTRDGILHVLEKMGAKIRVQNVVMDVMEPYGDMVVESSSLKNIQIGADIIPDLIDELPIIAVAALFAEGTCRVTGARELRVKESDRIATIGQMIEAMGGHFLALDDGFEITGPSLPKPFQVASRGDHRIAMSAIIAAYGAQVKATVTDCDCINTSFPNFFSCLSPFK